MLADPLYTECLDSVCDCGIDWTDLDGATIGISGATGLVGTMLVDSLMHKAHGGGFDARIVALGRNEARARARLPYFGEPGFSFQEADVSVPGSVPAAAVDVVMHLASPTHPMAYATRPISTVMSNIVGLQNMLEWQLASSGMCGRTLFASSVEIYGENRGDTEFFDESYSGYIDCCTLRAGYPEAKRLGEALCKAYAEERGMNVYLPRLPRLFGPTLLPSDTKALSQFIFNAVAGKDVVLKSAGMQRYSYLHVADAVAGLLWVLTKGETGTAYNVAGEDEGLNLRGIAEIVADVAGVSVIIDLPDEVERSGYSTATVALMDGKRLRSLGWKPTYNISDGIGHTISILKG